MNYDVAWGRRMGPAFGGLPSRVICECGTGGGEEAAVVPCVQAL